MSAQLLEAILEDTREAVAKRKLVQPRSALEQSRFYHTPVVSMVARVEERPSPFIIAEHKRKSPSKGSFGLMQSLDEITTAYMQLGAGALSILTNEAYFGGSLEDLRRARELHFCPLLRKDFIIDSYQLHEARAAGADVVLLIARCLEPAQLLELRQEASELGLEVLLEVHSAAEVEPIAGASPEFWGVNNRNLDTLTVDTSTTLQVKALLPEGARVIAESGISDADTVAHMVREGVSGFLVGEHFLRAPSPGRSCGELIAQSKEKLEQKESESISTTRC